MPRFRLHGLFLSFWKAMRSRKYFWHVATLTIIADAVLTQLIIRFVPYTEIDFTTYMRHIDVYLTGERNYTFLEGPSGPLVYPAGHVFVHQILHSVTSAGDDIRIAQLIYSFLYLLGQFLCFAIFDASGTIPTWVLPLLTLSKRLHSIYVLRLFNDCWAMPTLYAAILAYCKGYFSTGSILLSIALSVKMNILLYLPGVLVIIVKSRGVFQAIYNVIVILAVQVTLALPFLKEYPREYLQNAFQFSRVFLFKWTVNWRFVPEHVFLSRAFGLSLLGAHLTILVAFALATWCRNDGGALRVLQRGLRRPSLGAGVVSVTPDDIVTIIFTCNLIGILCARSLHYQFYAWYAQQLPFLAWKTQFPVVIKLILLGCIEYAWNVFPSTNLSSGMLLVSHLALLMGIWYAYPVGGRDADQMHKTD